MKIRLVSVGTGMPDWVTIGYETYADRLRGSVELELVEVPAGRRAKGADLERLARIEGEAIERAAGDRVHRVALDRRGKAWSTRELAGQMRRWMQEGRDVALLVGGPEGLSPSCLGSADQRWSLSALTMPHPLVRVVVAEQIYRAWTIIEGHPYHR